MKKVDTFSFSVALIINLLILLLIPGIKTPEVVGKIKVGLVSTGPSKNVAYEGKKEIESKEPPKPKEPKPPVENPQNIQVSEPVKELSLDNLSITAPTMDNALGKKSVKAKKVTTSSQSEKVREALDAPIKTIGNVAGVPSGYKLGATDGDIDAKWDPKNRNPEYPISAQQKGINGSVTLHLNIDAGGNIRSVTFRKRSGYPDIDNAIELVARSWKIHLSKNGKTVQGDVFLDYNFKLIGN
ncbi:MAG: energy transducer TonB [Fusobacteriaceae bacterium]